MRIRLIVLTHAMPHPMVIMDTAFPDRSLVISRLELTSPTVRCYDEATQSGFSC